jgi:spermidine/putrescine transport system permease protein
LNLLFNEFAVVVGLIYGYLPFAVLPMYASIEKFDHSLMEAAADLGAPPVARLPAVMLPMTLPGVVAALVLVFVPVVGAFITPDIMGGGKVEMIGTLINRQFGVARNWPFGSAMSLILMLLVLIGVIAYFRSSSEETRRACEREVPRLSTPAGAPGNPHRQLAAGRNAALVFGFLYLPVLILIIFSFNDTRSVAVFTGFSTEWYTRLAGNTELLEAARNSLLVGLITTIVATAIGTLTALAMERYRFKLRTAFDANLYLPIVIPEIVMGISLLLFFNQALFPFLQNMFGIRATTGLHTITISHIAFDIPFVYVIVRARLADFDRTLEEAAADLGADEWQTFKRVTLPLLMPGIIGGALLAFTLSLDDYLITVFTKGMQEQTMPLYIYSLVRRGVTPEINALPRSCWLVPLGWSVFRSPPKMGDPYTPGHVVRRRAGLGLCWLCSAASLFAPGGFTVGALLLRLHCCPVFIGPGVPSAVSARNLPRPTVPAGYWHG